MILIDTNVFIYFANGTLRSRELVRDKVAYATVTKIEALGYFRIHADELRALETVFSNAAGLPLSDQIISQAILFRQAKNMQLGDAIIAATAVVHQLELWTANTKDFRHIENLKLVDPFCA